MKKAEPAFELPPPPPSGARIIAAAMHITFHLLLNLTPSPASCISLQSDNWERKIAIIHRFIHKLYQRFPSRQETDDCVCSRLLILTRHKRITMTMTVTPHTRCCIATVTVTAAMLLASVVGVGSAFDDSTWYKRYPAYPVYCSTPEEMQRRGIPPLQDDDKLGETRLVHVTSVIRHGARTPWSSSIDCWDGYWTNPETGVWNCNLTTFLAAPPLTEEVGLGVEHVYVLFEKQYNALQFPLKNELNGTCQVGQLILRGFPQELQNGNHLRTAYAYDGTNMDHDIRMRLLDTTSATSPFQQLYYRSDDDQRTLMSGQVLLRGLFEKEFKHHAKTNTTHMIIPLHTADRNVDILSGDEEHCPRLQELQQQAQDSKEYKDYENSEQVQLLRNFMEQELGQVMEDEAIDCIMTTICTDRPLPEALDDYGRNTSKYHDTYGDNLLKRVYESVSDTEGGRPSNENVLHQISHVLSCHDRMSKVGPFVGNTTMEHGVSWLWDRCGPKLWTIFNPF
jgi:hypothetical protein